MKDGQNDIKVETLPNGVKRTTVVRNGNTTQIDVMPDGKRRLKRPDGRTHALPPLHPPVVVIPERK